MTKTKKKEELISALQLLAKPKAEKKPKVEDTDEFRVVVLGILNESINSIFQTDPASVLEVKMEDDLMGIHGFGYIELDEVIGVFEEILETKFDIPVTIDIQCDDQLYSCVRSLVSEACEVLIMAMSTATTELIPVYDDNGVQIGEKEVVVCISNLIIQDDDGGGSGGGNFPSVEIKANYRVSGSCSVVMDGLQFDAYMDKIKKDIVLSEIHGKKCLRFAIELNDAVAYFTRLISGNMYHDEDIGFDEIISTCEDIIAPCFLFIDSFPYIKNASVFASKTPFIDLAFNLPIEVEYLHHMQLHAEMLCFYSNELLQKSFKLFNYSSSALYSDFHPIVTKIVAITNNVLWHVDSNVDEIIFT